MPATSLWWLLSGRCSRVQWATHLETLDSPFLSPSLSSCSVSSDSSTGAVYCFMIEMFLNLPECLSICCGFFSYWQAFSWKWNQWRGCCFQCLVIVVNVDTSHSGIDENHVLLTWKVFSCDCLFFCCPLTKYHFVFSGLILTCPRIWKIIWTQQTSRWAFSRYRSTLQPSSKIIYNPWSIREKVIVP